MYSASEIDLPADGGALLAAYEAAAQPGKAIVGRLLARLMPRANAFVDARAKAARDVLRRGRCVEVRVTHEEPPTILSHEHGVIVLVGIDATRTLLLDISSVSDDPRWALHQAGTLMRRDWRWLRFGGELSASCFTAEGPATTATDLGWLHETQLENRLLADDGWPGDDAVLNLPLHEAQALARQAL